MNQKTKLTQIALWLLPTGLEVVVYITLVITSIIFSTFHLFKNFLSISDDFHPISSAVASVENLLGGLLGEEIAATLATAVFWGVIGMVVLLAFWIFENYSTELKNNLIISKYMHPAGTDRLSPLRLHLTKTILQIIIFILLIFYINYTIGSLLPAIGSTYNQLVANWPQSSSVVQALIAMIAELLVLHGFVIFARLLLLRKRVLES